MFLSNIFFTLLTLFSVTLFPLSFSPFFSLFSFFSKHICFVIFPFWFSFLSFISCVFACVQFLFSVLSLLCPLCASLSSPFCLFFLSSLFSRSNILVSLCFSFLSSPCSVSPVCLFSPSESVLISQTSGHYSLFLRPPFSALSFLSYLCFLSLLLIFISRLVYLSYLFHLSLSPTLVSFHSFSLLSPSCLFLSLSSMKRFISFPYSFYSLFLFVFRLFSCPFLFHFRLTFLSCQFSLLSSNLVLFSPIFLFFVLLLSVTSLLFSYLFLSAFV